MWQLIQKIDTEQQNRNNQLLRKMLTLLFLTMDSKRCFATSFDALYIIIGQLKL